MADFVGGGHVSEDEGGPFFGVACDLADEFESFGGECVYFGNLSEEPTDAGGSPVVDFSVGPAPEWCLDGDGEVVV